MKKFATMAISIALIGTMVAGGSLAYLQDTDSDVNVMTLGNVSIEQHEYERAVDANGAYATKEIDGVNSYVLKDFTQGKSLLPATESTNYGAGPWDGTTVRMTQVDSYGYMQVFTSKNAQDKFVTVENTGKTDAYVRTLVAFEVGDGDKDLIGTSYHFTWSSNPVGIVEIDGNNYYVTEYVYDGADGVRHENGILPAKDTTYPNLSQVYLKSAATNEDMEAIDGNGNGTLDILVLSQAVQAAGFEATNEKTAAQVALDAAFGEATADNVKAWFSGDEFKAPTAVSTATELEAALEAGESVYLTDDIALADDARIVIENGKVSTLNLNGYTLSGNNTATATHNFMIDVNGGTLNIENGIVSYTHTGANMGWNGATTVIDVTDGGVLNMNGVTVKVDDGTDMNFGVHLNNWGEVTLNADNCVFDSSYCGVRVFNSGYDMNNVTITDSTLKGKTRAFWVHNYIGDLNSEKHSDEAIKARLNLDIYGNGNTFELTEDAKSPIRYGFGTTVYFDANGNVVE